MPVRIYFCGEVVCDFWEAPPESNTFQLSLGGSLFHGATGARRAVSRENLPYSVGLITPLSSSWLGERFMKILQDLKIDTSGVIRVDRNPTVAIVSKGTKDNKFAFFQRDGADEQVAIEDLPAQCGDASDKKIFCFGSISTVIEPARFAWLEYARRQREHSLVFYDLNTRPSIAKDPAAYREIVKEWARTAHIMKASDVDIAWAYPDKNMKEVAQIWLNEGAHMAVFTKGEHGSEAHTKKVSTTIEAVDLVVDNTVGAGDNFNAGFAIHLARGNHFTAQNIIDISANDLKTALDGANKTAAHHLISNGARPASTKAVAGK